MVRGAMPCKDHRHSNGSARYENGSRVDNGSSHRAAATTTAASVVSTAACYASHAMKKRLEQMVIKEDSYVDHWRVLVSIWKVNSWKRSYLLGL